MVVSSPDAEYIRDDGFDGGGLLEGPGESGSVITARGGVMSGRHPDNLGGNQLLKGQVQQIQIRVGDGALRVFEDEEFSYTVIRPLNPSDPIDPFLFGFDPPHVAAWQ